jgi:hypothetical protein
VGLTAALILIGTVLVETWRREMRVEVSADQVNYQ